MPDKKQQIKKALQNADERTAFVRHELESSERANKCLAYLLGHKDAQIIQRDSLLMQGRIVITAMDRLRSVVSNPNIMEALIQCQAEVSYILVSRERLSSEQVKMVAEAVIDSFAVHFSTLSKTHSSVRTLYNYACGVMTSTRLQQQSYPIFDAGGIAGRLVAMYLYMRSVKPIHWFNEGAPLQAKTVFVEPSPGLMLDGLYLEKPCLPHLSSNHVVMVMLTRSIYYEHKALIGSCSQWLDFFGEDILFANHRNNSQHCGVQARSIEQIADDLQAFYDYLIKQGKRVSLYAMCGAAPAMILLADRLNKRGTSVRLVVDRFTKRYDDWVAPKQIIRQRDYQVRYRYIPMLEKQPGWRFAVAWMLYAAFIMLFWQTLSPAEVIYGMANGVYRLVLFYISTLYGRGVLWPVVARRFGFDYDFGRIASSLPEDSCLLLQVKSKKKMDMPGDDRLSMDLQIHPQCELRHAIKSRRQVERQAIKSIIDVVNRLNAYPEIKLKHTMTLMHLQRAFMAMLNMIDNEKLQGIEGKFNVKRSGIPRDDHAPFCFTLVCRNGEPASQLVQSFINPADAITLESFVFFHDLLGDDALVNDSPLDDKKQLAKLLVTYKRLVVRLGNRLPDAQQLLVALNKLPICLAPVEMKSELVPAVQRVKTSGLYASMQSVANQLGSWLSWSSVAQPSDQAVDDGSDQLVVEKRTVAR